MILWLVKETILVEDDYLNYEYREIRPGCDLCAHIIRWLLSLKQCNCSNQTYNNKDEWYDNSEWSMQYKGSLPALDFWVEIHHYLAFDLTICWVALHKIRIELYNYLKWKIGLPRKLRKNTVTRRPQKVLRSFRGHTYLNFFCWKLYDT